MIGTLALEAVGAVTLWFLFQGDPASATCRPPGSGSFTPCGRCATPASRCSRAGLARYDTHVSVQRVIMALVIAGGLGFPVLRELLLRALDWGVYTRITTSSRFSSESVSAFATLGLSTGITPELGVLGKLVVCATMFVGRVGPLTIALAVARWFAGQRYRLARESLPIG